MERAGVREDEDRNYVTYRITNGFVIKRKSDGKVLALPLDEETFELQRAIRGAKYDFIGGLLAERAPGAKWRSPRSSGIKRRLTEDSEYLYA